MDSSNAMPASTPTNLTEAHVEPIAPNWLQYTGWTFTRGPDIAPDEPVTERGDSGLIFLEQHLCDALLPKSVSEGSWLGRIAET